MTTLRKTIRAAILDLHRAAMLRMGYALVMIVLFLPGLSAPLYAADTATLNTVIEGLLNDDPFVRSVFREAITDAAGMTQLGAEIHQRYTNATGDKDLRVRLMRAYERTFFSNPCIPGSLPALLDGLDDPEPEVRWMAMRTLRFMESALAWHGHANCFLENPDMTAQISTAVQAILQNDSSASCRAEAAGCLAELRQVPEVLIAALDDSDPDVRANAVRGLCNFRLEHYQQTLNTAKATLEGLKSDPVCGIDATATLEYINGDHGWDPNKRALFKQAQWCWSYEDTLAEASAQLCLNRNRVAADLRIRQEVSRPITQHFERHPLGLAKGPLYLNVYALHNSNSRVVGYSLDSSTPHM